MTWRVCAADIDMYVIGTSAHSYMRHCLVHTPCMCRVVSTLLAAGQISWASWLGGLVRERRQEQRQGSYLFRKIDINKKEKQVNNSNTTREQENNKTLVVSVKLEKTLDFVQV